MPPKEKKERPSNFKSWETQSRLLSALVASLDNPRIDYKRIAKYLGGSATESSVEHRFRAIKVQADVVKGLVERGEDPELYKVYEIKNKGEMQKLFGASTPDGLGFQFRSINKGANVLKQAVANGEDPVDAFAAHLKGGSSAASSVPATPNHQRTTPASAKRTRSVKSTGAGAKRQKVIKPDPDLESDDDVDSPEADYSELDTTPTKLKPKVPSTPRKNPPLLPHSAWTKPGEKANSQPSPAATASVTPRPAAPSYALAPIPGSGSAVLPNGYTNPATGVGYNCAPPVTMTGAHPSAAHSTAMNMNGMRRGSAFSTESHTAGGSPPTPTLAYSFPVPNSGGNVPINHNGMGMTAGVTGMNRTNAATGTANIMGMPPNNVTSYNMTMFETASSPTASASDAQTPQTTTSSNTMAGFGTTSMATSFKSEEFTPFGGFGG